MDLTFTETIAAVLAANIVTVGFVFAVQAGLKRRADDTPWLIWAGLLMPLLFIVAAFFSTGDLPRHYGG